MTNYSILIGRVVKDPELKYAGDTAVVKLTVAIDRPVGKDKEKQTDFIPVTIFGKQAENVERYVKKGHKIAVEGRIQTSNYVNKDGVKVYTTDVMASRIEFLENASKSEPKADLPDGMTYAPVDELDLPF